MEVDSTPSTPPFMTSSGGLTIEGGEAEERPRPITPLNPASNVTTNNQALSITPMHVKVQAVDKAFVLANYSRLEPLMRRRMRELRLQGVAIRLNYSSEYVDEERELEAPPGFQPRPFGMTEEPIIRNIPPLLASHLRETERRRRTLSPREAVGVDRMKTNNIYPLNNVNPPNNIYPSSNVYPPNNIYSSSNVYPPNNIYPPNNVYPTNNNPPNNVYSLNNIYPPNNVYPSNNIYPTNNVYPPNNIYPPNNVYLPNNIYPTNNFCPLNGLRVSPYVGYYDGKGDPDDFIHAFEGATKIEKWVMPVSCHIPKEDVPNPFKPTKKQTMKHLAVNGIKRKEGESVRAFITQYTNETTQISKLNENQRIASFVHGKKRLSKVDMSSSWTSTHEKAAKRKTMGRVRKEEQRKMRHNDNRKVRDDTFYNALYSLIPIEVSECFNPEEKIIINPKYPEQTVTIGRQLPTKSKQRLINLLKDNANVLAWQYSDMIGIPRTLKIRGEIFFTEHKLKEDKKITPVQQKKRRIALDRIVAALKEVEELKKAGILNETRYQMWVANTVMVKKTDGA
ncbi:hypothetical protein Tco_1156801 [Tanacetum coccineum]